jgi:leucyl/phenylalanyl-tRNA--protein transferase
MQLSPELLLRAYAIGIFPMAESRNAQEIHWIDPDRRGVLPLDTWINPTIERLYVGLYEMGFAHSVETWRDGRLCGGLYGVTLGAAFFGESMFHRESDASKVALVHLAARLKKSGFQLLDTQFETPHLRQFGVVEVGREDYRQRLAKAVRTPVQLDSRLSRDELIAFLESSR